MLLFSINPPLPTLKVAAPAQQVMQVFLIHIQQKQHFLFSRTVIHPIVASFSVDVLEDSFVQSQL